MSLEEILRYSSASTQANPKANGNPEEPLAPRNTPVYTFYYIKLDECVQVVLCRINCEILLHF